MVIDTSTFSIGETKVGRDGKRLKGIRNLSFQESMERSMGERKTGRDKENMKKQNKVGGFVATSGRTVAGNFKDVLKNAEKRE